MSARQETPRFNLKATVKQTGVKPDTLRAWERRYGLPNPERSSGGHRLYSQHDIGTIKWLSARQRDGLSIKQAVEMYRLIEAEGRDPLAAAVPSGAPSVTVREPHLVGRTVSELRDQWIDACLTYDEPRTQQLLNQAFALYSPETVVVEVLQRAAALIGEGWYKGTVTVQQEHFCSGMVTRRLEALIMAAPSPSRPGRILLACPPHEQHVIGPLVLTYLLRRRGWEVLYLGANVPIEQLETMTEVTRPQVAISAAQQLRTAATLVEMAQALQTFRVPLAYGGLVFNLVPALRQRIAGHFLGEQLEAAPDTLESLMMVAQPVPTPEPISASYQQAREHFQERQGRIDAHALRALNSTAHEHNHLALASRELGTNIDAALALGDMDYLGADIQWATGLLKNRGLSAKALSGFLRAYHAAASEQLDERGKPIIEWLGRLLRDRAPSEDE